jgi:hypothetical protein
MKSTKSNSSEIICGILSPEGAVCQSDGAIDGEMVAVKCEGSRRQALGQEDDVLTST